MYLKVKGKGNDEWWVYECYKIHYETVDLSGWIEEEAEHESSPSWDAVIRNHPDQTAQSPDLVKLAYVTLSTGEKYTVLFDEAYLVGDNGETIEKIVV